MFFLSLCVWIILSGARCVSESLKAVSFFSFIPPAISNPIPLYSISNRKLKTNKNIKIARKRKTTRKNVVWHWRSNAKRASWVYAVCVKFTVARARYFFYCFFHCNKKPQLFHSIIITNNHFKLNLRKDVFCRKR